MHHFVTEMCKRTHFCNKMLHCWICIMGFVRWVYSRRRAKSLQWRHNESQITGVSMCCSNDCSSADQRKHQSSASLAFVRGIDRWPVDSPQKGPVTRKFFYLMTSSWGIYITHSTLSYSTQGRNHIVDKACHCWVLRRHTNHDTDQPTLV